MNSIAERHKYILEQLQTKGFVEVQALADELNVTGATIRKDLRVMEDQKLLIRSHGSATLVKPPVFDQNSSEKALKHSNEKNLIAKAASKLISSYDAIMLTSGSTIIAFAKAIPSDDNINIVTSSLEIAILLKERKNVNVMILGGRVYKSSMSVRGPYAEDGVKHINCSKLYIGCDGIDLEKGITCASIEEVRLIQVMMSRTSKMIVLADSSKFGKSGFGRICGIEDVDIIITDSGIPDAIREEIEEKGVQVIIAQ